MVLTFTAAFLGFLHTLFGPDHYVPFIMNIMLSSFTDVWELSTEKNISMRDSAFVIALGKMAKAIELRGIFS